MRKAETLNFAVSSGLKSVLGGELITDDEVALFELVKNSFDAEATQVNIFFDGDQIIVADDGVGMSYSDITQKWLFVAYSGKRESSGHGFRNEIANRRSFAGSKGIGRFSSDRLGKTALLQTRPVNEEGGRVHAVFVNWSLFEADQSDQFNEVAVLYSAENAEFSLPDGLPKLAHGTAITIGEAREIWDRPKLLRLKSALAKLINPFGSSADGFRIFIHAPAELANDELVMKSSKDDEDGAIQGRIVNGEVGNFIFSTLQEKTTCIRVSFDGKGFIESALTDRGEVIYRIREPNPYPLLETSHFHCELFFLNQSAKLTFARRMGVSSVNFGSIFLFRNGFRIFPVGEVGDDWFGVDRRKQQGYARFLGTRDLIGRIDVYGSGDDFKEASSRNAGLIANDAVTQLKDAFLEHCLKRLERYVVPVTFADKEDKHVDDITRLLTDPGKSRVTAAVAKLIDQPGVELLDYSNRLVALVDERSSQFEQSLASLRSIAERTGDRALLSRLEDAEKKFSDLKRSEEAARRQADEERQAKEQAEARATAAEESARAATELFEEEKKRNFFLASIATLDTDTILTLHHQVTIYAVDIQQQIENFLFEISKDTTVTKAAVIDAIERIALLNRKIMGVSKFATKANFRLESEQIEADLGAYIQQYIEGIARDFLQGPMRLEVSSDGKEFVHRFKPIDIAVVVDNLIANARKAGARRLLFEISHPEENSIHIDVVDDGKGLSPAIGDRLRIFEKGFTTTDGSGLGLFHVAHVLGEINGTIEIVDAEQRGAAFVIRISK